MNAWLVSLGLTRDHALWFWGKLLSVATLITTGALDLDGTARFLGVPLSPTGLHWFQAGAVVVLYLSGQYSKSPLPAKKLAVLLPLLLVLGAPLSAADRRTPDPALTPGATRPVTMAELCTPGSASKARAVSTATKKAVFARYGVKDRPGAYEVDHLISLELGGSNDVANLWPQPYHGVNNAHDKDRLENQLHALVCKGTVSLEAAQHAIATDWIGALKTYGGKVGPR